MKQENESAVIDFHGQARGSLSSAHGAREGEAPAALLTEGATRVPVIDFHSAELNRTDDLNDNSGICQSFQTLDGVVTAHERHQMERQRRNDSADLPVVDGAAPLKRTEKGRDEADAAQTAVPLTVVSKGRTLIIDMDAERALACAKMLRDRRLVCTTLLVTKSASAGIAFPRRGRLAPLEVDGVSVAGAFGGFSATVTVKGIRKHLREWLGDDAAVFDLVLDLQPTPSFASDFLPIGYYAPGPSTTALGEAMAELPQMRGRFKKPQFISFQETRCFHGRSRIRECRQCLDICPVGAIESAHRKISINHYLCQGCGGCALVCPAEAIRLVQPSREELLNRLQSRLQDLSVGVGAPSTVPSTFSSTLVISDLESAGGNHLSGTGEGSRGRGLHLEVEQIASVGLEVLLAALAYGAGEILVACGPRNPPGIRKAVEWQVQMARAILKGIGLRMDNIRLTALPSEEIDSESTALQGPALDVQAGGPPAATATFSPVQDKWTEGRMLIRLAAQRLYDQSGASEPHLALPIGSPFGAVAVNAATCTLCMACVASCPSGALSATGNAPRLLFRESQCHQCGLCKETCPEGAIRLLPRLLCDPEAVKAQVVLREANALRCIECGVPFGSQAMIDRIKGKLAGHWMYANERQIRRLQMCGTCRARDALSSPEMNAWKP